MDSHPCGICTLVFCNRSLLLCLGSGVVGHRQARTRLREVPHRGPDHEQVGGSPDHVWRMHLPAKPYVGKREPSRFGRKCVPERRRTRVHNYIEARACRRLASKDAENVFTGS